LAAESRRLEGGGRSQDVRCQGEQGKLIHGLGRRVRYLEAFFSDILRLIVAPTIAALCFDA
jgi:hypothetical protein